MRTGAPRIEMSWLSHSEEVHRQATLRVREIVRAHPEDAHNDTLFYSEEAWSQHMMPIKTKYDQLPSVVLSESFQGSFKSKSDFSS